MHKKLFAILLAALLTSSVLTGCGGDAAADETTADTAAVETAAEETETKPLRSADLLPAADFGGADYVIIGREYAKLGELPGMEFVVEELTGDIINDPIYKRNQTVEAKNLVPAIRQDMSTAIKVYNTYPTKKTLE